MLRMTSEKALPNRFADSILRHRVRNLRAKVKTLLPVDVCGKYGKRNSKVKRIQQSKDFMRKTLSPSAQWGGFEIENEPFYFEQRKDRNNHHFFDRLSNDQIQQILEDKIYYLGKEKHIKAFDEFVQRKKSHFQPRPKMTPLKLRNSQIHIRGFSDLFNESKILQFAGKKPDNSYTRSRTMRQISRKTVQSSKVIRNTNPYTQTQRESFQVRKTYLNEAEVLRRSQIKGKIEEKQENALNNHTRIRMEAMATLREMSRDEKKRYLQAKKRRIASENRGQIVDLNEKVRQICLARKMPISEMKEQK